MYGCKRGCLPCSYEFAKSINLISTIKNINIYISDLDTASCHIVRQKLKIERIISLGEEKATSYFIKDNNHLHFPIRDDGIDSILPILPTTNAFIRDSILSNNNILIHCMAGISRSVSVVIAFIMDYFNISYDEAYKFVKSKRSCAEPNSKFRSELKSLEYKIF
jgi:protein-tyrosine phosphatase